MITCPKCHYVRQPTDLAPEYECPSCGIVYAKYHDAGETKRLIGKAIASGDWSRLPVGQVPREHHEEAIRNMPISTTPGIPGREVKQSLDVISAECAFGMNLLRDWFASITDVVGGRSGSTQKVLKDARQKALLELRREAFACGANAVIGVDLDYSEFSGGGKAMLFVVASGTAVVLETGATP